MSMTPDPGAAQATVLHELGMSAFHRGNVEVARKFIAQVLDCHPNLMRADAVAGEFTRNWGGRGSAQRRVERALVVGPDQNGIPPRRSGSSRGWLRTIARQ